MRFNILLVMLAMGVSTFAMVVTRSGPPELGQIKTVGDYYADLKTNMKNRIPSSLRKAGHSIKTHWPLRTKKPEGGSKITGSNMKEPIGGSEEANPGTST